MSLAVIGHNAVMREKCRWRGLGAVWIDSEVWEHSCGLWRCTAPAFVHGGIKSGIGGGF